MIDIVKLDNGVRIAFEKMPYVNSVAFGIWVKNGSRYEKQDENGISHFIEHLLFKGTKKRTAKQIAKEMDLIGGHINAFTSKEYTCYYTKTLDKNIDKAVDVLADMFFNSNFDEDEIRKELNVITEEIAMYEDSPDDLCIEIFHEGVFKDTSLSRPILGTVDTISKFNHNSFKNYMKNHYVPENIVISVAGSFDKEEVVKIIEEYFGDFTSDIEQNHTFESKYSKTFVTKEKDIEQLHLILGFESYGVGHDRAYDVVALNTVLGGGMSSRLFQKVREERGLCYSIYTQSLSYSDIGSFTIYSALNKGNANELVEVSINEIKKLKDIVKREGYLQEKKEQISCNYLLGLENSINRMSAIGRSVILHDKIYTKDEILKKIDNVNVESLSGVIDYIFDMDKLSVSLTGNIEGVNLKV